MGGWGSGGNPPSQYHMLETYVPLSLPDLRRGGIIEPGGECEGVAYLDIWDYWSSYGAFKFQRFLTYSREPFERDPEYRHLHWQLGYRYSVPAGFLEVWHVRLGAPGDLAGRMLERFLGSPTRVAFRTTRTASGGERLWLTCPECGTLRDKLHAPGFGPFKCRVCYRLTYRSSLCSGKSKRIRAMVRRTAAEMGLKAPLW